MILTDRKNGRVEEFEQLLEKAHKALNIKALAETEYFSNRSPADIEKDVYESIVNAAVGSSFSGKISLIAKHTFPDIIVNSCFGVEVKTTKSNSWKSTGNSVLETTRPSEMKYIYLFFAKLSPPVEFRYKPYSECLYNVAVTHSPRYLIDMDLKPSETIFKKMKITYDELRLTENPIKQIMSYLRSISKPGKEPWWLELDTDADSSVSATITPWSDLSTEKKNELLIEMFVRFPELFGSSSKKYLGPGSYLMARHGVLSTNIRDIFSAGGTVSRKIESQLFSGLPQVFGNFHERYMLIQKEVEKLDLEEAIFYWQLNANLSSESLLSTWRNLILHYLPSNEKKEVSKRYLIEVFRAFDRIHEK